MIKEKQKLLKISLWFLVVINLFLKFKFICAFNTSKYVQSKVLLRLLGHLIYLFIFYFKNRILYSTPRNTMKYDHSSVAPHWCKITKCVCRALPMSNYFLDVVFPRIFVLFIDPVREICLIISAQPKLSSLFQTSELSTLQ